MTPDLHDHLREPVGPTALAPTPPTAPPPLAVHGDPSRPDPTQTPSALPAMSTPHAQVAWVRPSELSTLVGRELLGRAVELQSAFAKGTWRAPVKVVRAVRDRIATRNTRDPDFNLPRREPVAQSVGDGLDPMDPILDGPHDEGVQLA